jgi:hypothetical protein
VVASVAPSYALGMYRRFSFERETDVSLDCVPLAVRRKLDLAALKISLAGWQSLPRAQRLALCHLPVDTALDLEVYREVLRSFAAAAGAELKPLPETSPSAWSADAIPPRVAERAIELAFPFDLAAWRALDEETRYCLVKYATTKDDAAKVRLLFEEAFAAK